MPVRRTAKKSSPLSLAFIGSGEVTEENVAALLDDFCDGQEPSFLIPVTQDHWNDNLAEVVGYAIEKDIPYEVVVDDGSSSLKGGAAKALKNAQKSHKIKKVTAKLVSLLTDMDNPKLVTLWSDDDEECGEAAEMAIDASIEVLDLCNGLEEVEFDDAETKDETEEEPGEDEPYTEAELKELDIDALKEICKENEIPLPPPRSRQSSYIKAIMEFQEEEGSSEPEEGEKPSRSRSKAETNGHAEPTDGARLINVSITGVCPHCDTEIEIPISVG